MCVKIHLLESFHPRRNVGPVLGADAVALCVCRDKAHKRRHATWRLAIHAHVGIPHIGRVLLLWPYHECKTGRLCGDAMMCSHNTEASCTHTVQVSQASCTRTLLRDHELNHAVSRRNGMYCEDVHMRPGSWGVRGATICPTLVSCASTAGVHEKLGTRVGVLASL